jgi:hypothetical protein
VSREQSLPPKQSPSLGRLARRISAWTTNSLITVMLVVIALGFGREVLHWWHDEPAVPAAAPLTAADPLGDGAATHDLEFGDQAWSIRRQEFSGRSGNVSAALQAACRAAIVDSQPRGESPDAAEEELLKRLAVERPVAEERGQWRLYRWGDNHPIFIGTRAVGWAGVNGEKATPGVSLDQARIGPMRPIGPIGPISPMSPIGDERKPGTNLDKTPYRVVIWGIAVPAAGRAWILYMFQSRDAAGVQSRPEAEIPLPPAGRRLISIRAGGGAITAFSAGDGDAARGFYDRWFADHGWIVAQGWQRIASGWQARFETRSSPALAVDIRLGMDRQGRWTGLVMESQLERGRP